MRDDEAVSAAVATVLLFGGVVTIIGLMLISMTPIIEELEGSIKRNDMEIQMRDMAHEITMLSETGMPGDRAEIDLFPVEGEMGWDRLRGGMWYSASWHEGHSMRINGAIDLDKYVEIRHPESKVATVCFEDMRLGPDRPYYYAQDNSVDAFVVTPKHGLAAPLGPVEVVQGDLAYEMLVGGVLRLDSSQGIASSHELTGYVVNGGSGATFIEPTQANPVNGKGRHFTIPLLSGNTTVEVISTDDMMVNWKIDDAESEQIVTMSDGLRMANSWLHQFTVNEDKLLEVNVDTDARVIIVHENSGIATLTGEDSSKLSTDFMLPSQSGNLIIHNPNQDQTTIIWRNGGVSVPGNSTLEVQWPPNNIQNGSLIESNSPVTISWETGNQGMHRITATDTGQDSGLVFNIEDSTNTSISEMGSENGEVQIATHSDGDSGIISLRHDGAKRCLSVNKMASGWIELTLPWKSLNGLPEGQIINSWREGTHPASLEIQMYGEIGERNMSMIATSWAFHTSRLTYEFESSISGLEVAWSSGAVVTNHPEMSPTVLVGPSDRGGPGPRFSATVPSMHPTSDSVSGSGAMEFQMELTMRTSLASFTAYDVRRAWVGPYGTQIAANAANGLDQSEDWIVSPGRLDLLEDYVGWVPIPSHGPSEAVWHTSGEPIQFNLQISSIDVRATEAGI
ncbi:MAG: hypothetical protein QGI21_06065 [Candidatus Poseidoniaceae archaeon]|nr:hypothetical protein [Candidatus Poseidoniaceae archaeon]